MPIFGAFRQAGLLAKIEGSLSFLTATAMNGFANCEFPKANKNLAGSNNVVDSGGPA